MVDKKTPGTDLVPVDKDVPQTGVVTVSRTRAEQKSFDSGQLVVESEDERIGTQVSGQQTASVISFTDPMYGQNRAVLYRLSDTGNWNGANRVPSYNQYRELRKDPTVWLARRLVTAPILCCDWNYEENSKAPDGARDFIESELTKLRLQFCMDAAYGNLDFGWQGFEKVCSLREYGDFKGQVGVDCLKPLLQDITTILIDVRTGTFKGYVQWYQRGFWQGLVAEQPIAADTANKVQPRQILLTPRECMHTVFNREGTQWYGWPDLEIARQSINQWTIANDAAARYDKKLAGSHWVVYYPSGKSEINGVETDNLDIARSIIIELSASGAVAVPSTINAMMQELTKDTPNAWRVELLSDVSAQSGFVDRLKYLDALKVRAMGLPERAVLEGQFGTKAEAEAHADMAITNIELRHKLLCQMLSVSLVDPLLITNYGPEAKGTVYVEPQPLVDMQRATLMQIYLAFLANPENAAVEYMSMDMEKYRDRIGVPANPNVPDHVDLLGQQKQEQAELDQETAKITAAAAADAGAAGAVKTAAGLAPIQEKQADAAAKREAKASKKETSLSNDQHLPAGSPNGGQFAPKFSSVADIEAHYNSEHEAAQKRIEDLESKEGDWHTTRDKKLKQLYADADVDGTPESKLADTDDDWEDKLSELAGEYATQKHGVNVPDSLEREEALAAERKVGFFADLKSYYESKGHLSLETDFDDSKHPRDRSGQFVLTSGVAVAWKDSGKRLEAIQSGHIGEGLAAIRQDVSHESKAKELEAHSDALHGLIGLTGSKEDNKLAISSKLEEHSVAVKDHIDKYLPDSEAASLAAQSGVDPVKLSGRLPKIREKLALVAAKDAKSWASTEKLASGTKFARMSAPVLDVGDISEIVTGSGYVTDKTERLELAIAQRIGARAHEKNYGVQHTNHQLSLAYNPDQVRDEHGQWAYTPGESQAKLTHHDYKKSEIAKSCKKLGIKPSDVPNLVGAPDDSLVNLSGDGDPLYVSMIGHGYKAQRTLERDTDGKLVIKNLDFRVDPSRQKDGLGTSILHRQVYHAGKLGVDRIETFATRGLGDNGYYTWPRLGYDGPIPNGSGKQVSEMLSTKEGTALWKETGGSLHLSFDPHPSSLHRARLDAYIDEKRRTQLSNLSLEFDSDEQRMAFFGHLKDGTLKNSGKSGDPQSADTRTSGAVEKNKPEGEKKMDYSNHELRIHGATKQHKELLKARGFRWNGEDWTKPVSAEHAQQIAEQAKNNSREGIADVLRQYKATLKDTHVNLAFKGTIGVPVWSSKTAQGGDKSFQKIKESEGL